MGVLWGCYVVVLWWCYGGATSVLQVCCKGVTRVLQGCYKDVIVPDLFVLDNPPLNARNHYDTLQQPHNTP
jgi:hypothetical protein